MGATGRRSPAYVRLIRPAIDDLERLGRRDPQIVRWALRKMLLLERDPDAGEPLLGALVGWRKLVVGDRHWRIVWRVTTDDAGGVIVDVAEVWAVGARADAEVYAELRRRTDLLGAGPEAEALARVLEALGKVGQGITAAAEPTDDPVPPWLVERLTRQVGLPLAEVVSMTGEAAMDRWEAFITGQR